MVVAKSARMKLSDLIEDLLAVLEHKGDLYVHSVEIDVSDTPAEEMPKGGITMTASLIDHLAHNRTQEQDS